MSLSTVRTKIYDILSGVSGVGKVYNRERYSAQWIAALNTFKTAANKIDGWTMRMQAAAEDPGTSRTNRRYYNIVLRHYYGYDDTNSSQITFEDFNETVCNAFRALPDLEGVAEIAEPPQIIVSEPRMFIDILCHYAEILIRVELEIQY